MLSCPSLSPGVRSNSCPLRWWYHPIISPLLPPSPPALSLSQHEGLFQWISSSHQVTKVLELQHQSFQWILRVISFRFDWFDLLALQGTLKNLQNHSSKVSILWCSAFFMVYLSYPRMTTGKAKALMIQMFVSKASSRRWWKTGKSGMLQSMGLQRVGHDWATKQQQNTGCLWYTVYPVGSLTPDYNSMCDLSSLTIGN